MRVLVTGGAGYVGSVVVEELVEAGHDVLVYDSLSRGHRGAVLQNTNLIVGDVNDCDKLRGALGRYRVEAVVHMAADSLVAESMQQPGRYYRNNVSAGISLLEAMRTCGVNRLVFSSSAAVYGEPETQPIEETAPTCPTSPYGETKLAFERAMHWYEKAAGIRFVSLRYFNAAGATKRCGEAHEPETHLIPIVLQVAAERRQCVTINGADYPTPDGTCIRDYVHVSDLARAHVLSLGILMDRSAIYNLGCGGAGYSVHEVIEAASEVTGREIPSEVGPRRAGDPAVLVASSAKIQRELGWTPRHQDLHTILASAWEWMQARSAPARPRRTTSQTTAKTPPKATTLATARR